jgi:large subunit ribosomal protein L24
MTTKTPAMGKQKIFKIRLKKGDLVVVRAGKYKGKTGKVVATHPRANQVTVDGINIVKKHVKPNREHPQGAIVELTKPLWVSKVSIVEPISKKPSRIGYKLAADGTKTRVFKRTNKEIK